MNTTSEIPAPATLPDTASDAVIAAYADACRAYREAVAAAEPQPISHGLALVIADRGHVWIGRAVTRGDWTHIAAGRVVRRWGTTEGVNQLVKGPTPSTKLDAPADLKVATRAVIAIVPVEESAWPNA